MFICAFTAWVKGPSILFTFILKRCHAFIISVIVVTRRSVIFIVHSCGIWSQSTTAGQITSVPNWFPACDVQMGTLPYEPWDWIVWAIDLSQPTMVVGRLDQMSSNVVTFWVLSLAFWIKVFGDGHHWLLSPCCYTTSMWAVPTCNRQNLGAISSRLDTQKNLDDLLHSGKASPLLSGWGLSYNHRQHMQGRLLELDMPKIEMGLL